MNNLIEISFRESIVNRRKVKFRMDGSPQQKYFLYHPYALIKDKFNDEVSIYGLVEKDYEISGERNNTFQRPTLASIKEVYPQSDTFVPDKGWKEKLEKEVLEYLISVDM